MSVIRDEFIFIIHNLYPFYTFCNIKLYLNIAQNKYNDILIDHHRY